MINYNLKFIISGGASMKIRGILLGVEIVLLYIFLCYLGVHYDWTQNNWFIPLITAIPVASITQLLNNYLTKKREKEKLQIETLKKYYFKVCPFIFDIVNIETEFRQHDLKISGKQVGEFERKISSIISDNMLYITNNTYQKLIELNKDTYYEDLSGFHKDLKQLEFYISIIEGYIEAIEETNLKKLEYEYRFLNLLILLVILVEINGDYYNACRAVSLNFYFNSNKINSSRLYRKLKKINKIDLRDKKQEKLKIVLKSLVKKEDADVIEQILEFGPVYENSAVIGKMANKDLVSVGDLDIPTRTMFREELLNEYFDQKYTKKEDGYNPKYNNYTLDEYDSLGGELKYAIEYLCDKGYLIKKNKDGRICLLITSQGEDLCTEKYFENQQIVFHI